MRKNDDNGDGTNFKMTCELHSGLYFVLVRGFGNNTGSYTLHVHRPSDDAATTRAVAKRVNRSFHPFLLPLSTQLAILKKFPEGTDE